MPSFLGGKSRGAFGQPAFFLPGNCMTIFACEKEVSLKACLFSNTIVRQCRSFKLEKKILSYLLIERKSSKEYSVVFLVEGEKFKLRNLPSRTSSLLCSAANSVCTSLLLNLQHLAGVLTPNIADLMLSGFFCPQPSILWSKHISPGKIPACLSRSINSRIRIKIIIFLTTSIRVFSEIHKYQRKKKVWSSAFRLG